MGCLISLPVYQIILTEINDDTSENYLCFQEFENENGPGWVQGGPICTETWSE